jgi:hypothetical protein
MQKKSAENNIKLSDGGGLYLLLDKKGGAYWHFDYIRPITKKRATIAIGVYPSCTLASARAKRSEFREQLAYNIDPTIQKKREDVSYFAFTATPKNTTLEKFGQQDSTGKYVPFHLYGMKQAIEEGFILDVLANYTTYKSFYEIQKSIEDNPMFE